MAKQEMKWDSRDECYHGVTSDGREIVVEGVEYAEAVQDIEKGEYEKESWKKGELAELADPDTWLSCLGANQNVSVKR